MRKIFTLPLAALVALVASAIAIASTGSATTVVYPGHESGWAAQSSTCGAPQTSSQSFVTGPATPPLGVGSRQFTIGPNGDSEEDYRQSGYAGTPLTSLTALSYSTLVQVPGSGGQANYLILNVDTNGDGLTDDLLFFEPTFQNGTYGGDPVPNQGNVVVGSWQTWDALHGGWWSLNAGTYGPPLTTLASYAAANPGAKIINSASGLGGVRVVAGCGLGDWDNFVGNADAFTIGVNGSSTTYDFEPAAPAVGPPTSKEQCKNGGWKTFNTPRKFKNQGDCIQYVNTGK